MSPPNFDNNEVFKEWSEHFLTELKNTENGLVQIRKDLESLRIGVRRYKKISALWGVISALFVIGIFTLFSSISEHRVAKNNEFYPIVYTFEPNADGKQSNIP